MSTNSLSDISVSPERGATAVKFFQGSVLVIFFLCGLIVSFNSIIVPHVKSLFALNYQQAMWIDFAFGITFLVVSYPAGIIFERKGAVYTLNLGVIGFIIGSLSIYPAFYFLSYPLVLVSLFILGCGFNLILIAGYPFLAALGRPETASSRVTLGTACMAVGQTLAPLLGTLYVLRDTTSGSPEKSARLQTVYVIFAVVLIFIYVVAARLTKAGDIQKPESSDGGSFWSHRHLLLAFGGIFFYIGIEAYVASLFIIFATDINMGNLSVKEAGFYFSGFWLSFTLARFGGAMILRKWRTERWLCFNVVMAIIVMIGIITLKGPVVVWLLILLAIFNSMMFPSIFSLGIRGLGKFQGKGSALLFIAISGGAVLPVIQGTLADATSLQFSLVISFFCYAYILFYGLSGYKIVKKREEF